MIDKEEFSDFTIDLRRITDSLRDITSRSKDYYKFVIGLSTGALVFSVTLNEKFRFLPTYQPIILIGWVCLIISIITGVWLLRKQDDFESYFKAISSLLSDPPLLYFGFDKDFGKLITRSLIISTLKKEKSKETKNEERIKELEKQLVIPKENVGKTFLSIMDVLKEIIEKKYPAWSPVMNDIIKEAKAWGNFLRKQGEVLYAPDMAKKLRKTIVRMQICEKVMMVCFFAGIIMITLFSTINILSIDIMRVIRSLF
jgi:hypothetical protein